MSTNIPKVKIGNGDYISIKRKGTITIIRTRETKLIYDVLYMPEINYKLLSVGKLIEKGLKVIFEVGCCLILAVNCEQILKVRMKGKSFSFDPIKDELVAFSTTASNTTWSLSLANNANYEGQGAYSQITNS